MLDLHGLRQKNPLLVLFLVSVLGLFLELVLIRWIGTEIRIFAYLQNVVLVVCFMGLGLGCLTAAKPFSLLGVLLPLAALLLLLAVPATRNAFANISVMLAASDELLIWYEMEAAGGPFSQLAFTALGIALTVVLSLLIAAMFVPLGRLLGQLMAGEPRTILAYSVNVAGSLLGVWLFVAMAAFSLPPLAWFCVAAALMLLLPPGKGKTRLFESGLIAAVVVVSWFAVGTREAKEVVWSPYQKLALKTREAFGLTAEVVQVNNVGYQSMLDLSAESPRRQTAPGISQYDVPMRMHPHPARVLVVGAGTGNDVAGALRNGAERVVAVEIDPAILSMGKRLHPERPYDSGKVSVVIDDARSFFATTNERFDVIQFGLLDSHTTTAMTNARLDHFVYTRESLERARSLLADGGVLTLSFAVQKPFIADRMERALREVFGAPPIVVAIPPSALGWGSVIFVAGDQAASRARIEADAPLAAALAYWAGEFPMPVLPGDTRVATDDWPYIYLDAPRVPLVYLVLGLTLSLLLLRVMQRLGVGLTSAGTSESHFFFLGAAFLLLEAQNISKSSVVLGNTWQVNAVMISGILAMVLVANLVVAKRPALPLLPVYLLLGVVCLVLYFVDLARFAFLPYGTKAVLVGGLTSLPMLFSGIVFARSFASAKAKDIALGANLLGSLAGGMLQAMTFLTGIRALLLVVAAFYLAAFLTRPGGRFALAREREALPGVLPPPVPVG